MLFQQKNQELQTVYSGITQNKQGCLIFIVVPSKKKKKKRSKIGKKEKEKKGQGVAKISLDRIQKEKYPKKDINDDDINDEGKK